jgi:hypothetical protein
MIKSRKMEWIDMWYAWERNACAVLIGRPEGERPLGRPRHTWKNNIKEIR